MRVKSWRIPTWLIVAWSFTFGLLAGGDILSQGSPEGLQCLWGYCAGVSLWSWAMGMAPLALLWYATRHGVPRIRIIVVVLATFAVVAMLMAGRQWPEVPPASAAPSLGVPIEVRMEDPGVTSPADGDA